jgi:hypothetical protein
VAADPGAGSTPDGPRSPRDYRPDLRPMLILVILLVLVVIGWILLSPAILPDASAI